MRWSSLRKAGAPQGWFQNFSGWLALPAPPVLLPLVLPPVVGGIALIYTFGRQGLLGGTLEFLGLRIAFVGFSDIGPSSFFAGPSSPGTSFATRPRTRVSAGSRPRRSVPGRSR